MKVKSSIIFCVFPVLFGSCTLKEVVDRGDDCPPKNADPNAILAYVNKADACSVNDDMCAFKSAFTERICPVQYKHCMQLDELNYYCAESKDCPEGSYRCDGKCISPKSNDHCGILSDCSGGVKCADDESCLGADDGYKCTKLVVEVCAEDHIPIRGENDELRCIDPNSNKFCGATGIDNLGKECQMHQVCLDGVCACEELYFECDGKCVAPSDEAYCGISQNCTDDQKPFVNCKELSNKIDGLYACKLISEDGKYQCALNSCPNDKTRCGDKCIDKLDDENCGDCNISCLHKEINTKLGKCVELNGEYKCEFACEEGYLECGDGVDKKCIDKNVDSLNCGKCGHICGENERCFEGACVEMRCKGNDVHKCYTEENGCIESNMKCGPDCITCEDGQLCTSGICHMTSCPDGQHIQYDLDAYSAKCVENSIIACAPGDNKFGDVIHNCVDEFENAAGVDCEQGKCVVKSCKSNYHLKEGKCVNDSLIECGDSLMNCSEIENINGSICDDGNCVVTECKAGYHEYLNRCEKNDADNCGAHNEKCSVKNGQEYECKTDADNHAECFVTLCQFAYHPDIFGKTCVVDKVTECGSYDNVCASKYNHCIIYRDKSRCGNCNTTDVVNHVIFGGTTGGRCYVMPDKCDEIFEKYSSSTDLKDYQFIENRACVDEEKYRGVCAFNEVDNEWFCDSTIKSRQPL